MEQNTQNSVSASESKGTKKVLLSLILAFALGFLFGHFGSQISYDKKGNLSLKQEDKNLNYLDVFVPNEMHSETRFIQADVFAVKSDSVTVQTHSEKRFDVLVDDKTKITKQVAKDPDVYQKELEKYQADTKAFFSKVSPVSKTASSSVALVPPALPFNYSVENISINDIKAGDKLSVFSDENMFGKTSAKAISVEVMLKQVVNINTNASSSATSSIPAINTVK